MIINLRNEIWKDFTRPSWRTNEIFKISNYGRIIRYKFDLDGKLFTPYNLGGYDVF